MWGGIAGTAHSESPCLPEVVAKGKLGKQKSHLKGGSISSSRWKIPEIVGKFSL
jgi:hypothetical protein